MQAAELPPAAPAMDIQEVGARARLNGSRHCLSSNGRRSADSNRSSASPLPASELTVALQCGGSERLFGVAATRRSGAAAIAGRPAGTVIRPRRLETTVCRSSARPSPSSARFAISWVA